MTILLILVILPLMFLTDSCSCYKYQITFYDKNNKPVLKSKFTKPNIYAVPDSLNYLLENFSDKEIEFSETLLNFELQKLKPIQQLLIREKIKKHEINNISKGISLSPVNLFYSSNLEKESKKLKEIVNLKTELKDKEKLLLTDSKENSKEI